MRVQSQEFYRPFLLIFRPPGLQFHRNEYKADEEKGEENLGDIYISILYILRGAITQTTFYHCLLVISITTNLIV